MEFQGKERFVLSSGITIGLASYCYWNVHWWGRKRSILSQGWEKGTRVHCWVCIHELGGSRWSSPLWSPVCVYRISDVLCHDSQETATKRILFQVVMVMRTDWLCCLSVDIEHKVLRAVPYPLCCLPPRFLCMRNVWFYVEWPRFQLLVFTVFRRYFQKAFHTALHFVLSCVLSRVCVCVCGYEPRERRPLLPWFGCAHPPSPSSGWTRWAAVVSQGPCKSKGDFEQTTVFMLNKHVFVND